MTKFYIRYGKDGVGTEIKDHQAAEFILYNYFFENGGFTKTWQKLLAGKIIKVGVQELFIKTK